MLQSSRRVSARVNCLVREVHSHSHGSSHENAHSHSHADSHSRPVENAKTESAGDEQARLTLSRSREYCQSLLAGSPVGADLVLHFTPRPCRDEHVAIHALAVSLQRALHPPASTISMASGTSTATARLRLQFWKQTLRDVLAGSAPPAEPVAVLLAEIVRRRTYTRSFFTRMVDARMARVGDGPFANVAAVAEYGEGAYASMLYLLGESAASARAADAEHVYSHVGRAMGVVDVLADFPGAVERRRRVLLPVDVMLQHRLREEDVLRRLDGADADVRKKLQDAVFEVATHASDQLITARSMLAQVRTVNDAVFAPMLAAVATQTWLDQLQRADFDLYHPSLKVRRWSLPWKMYWAYKRRQI